MDLPTFEDVVFARERIRGRVETTPLLRVPRLDARAGVELFLKAESLQRIGAFKARGAMNAVLSLPEEGRRRGLCTFSSGNHGQAVALAGRELGVAVYVVMPEDAPAVKVESVRELGGEVTFAGKTTADREKVALEIVERTGAALVPPFDDASVIAGQGTATLELIEQAAARGAELDAVLVPVGGGGLLAGACLAASGHPTAPAVIAVEPEAADAFKQSFLAKERVSVDLRPTIADGLKPVRVGERNFAIASRIVREAITVSESAIARAVRALLFEAKLVVEPSGACALAAALERSLPSGVKRAGVILTGGNVAPAVLRRLIDETA
ncbi:MAG: threonine/serine dehydratase [Polyangiaceae bacterium]|nr:threonine/serine dehydratase [Polyangiaceae bacterium]